MVSRCMKNEKIAVGGHAISRKSGTGMTSSVTFQIKITYIWAPSMSSCLKKQQTFTQPLHFFLYSVSKGPCKEKGHDKIVILGLFSELQANFWDLCNHGTIQTNTFLKAIAVETKKEKDNCMPCSIINNHIFFTACMI